MVREMKCLILQIKSVIFKDVMVGYALKRPFNGPWEIRLLRAVTTGPALDIITYLFIHLMTVSTDYIGEGSKNNRDTLY